MQHHTQIPAPASNQLGHTILRMRNSFTGLQRSISGVRYAEQGASKDGARAVDFYVDGTAWRGYLAGDNQTLCVSNDDQAANRSLAMRLIFDKMAWPRDPVAGFNS